MFVKNMDGWLNYALSGIEGLKETLSGNVEPWTWLDKLWTKTQQIAAHLMQLDKSKYVKVDGGIGALLTYAGGILALLAAAFTFLMAEVTLKMLAVTAPLFIFCLSYGFLRQMFNNWLQLIISSCLVLMFGSLALRAGTSYLNGILSMAVTTATDRNLMQVGATSLIASIFMAFVIWQAKNYASQIASVGVEGAMGMGALSFGAGRLGMGILNAEGRGTMGFGRGVLGQKGGFGKSTGLSGKAGNIVGQGVQGVGKGTYSVGKAVVKQVRQRSGN